MSFNLIWKLESGILLASDSKSNIFSDNQIVHRKTQKAFKINCHFPLGALSTGSVVIGELPVTDLLSQNYEKERNSVEEYAKLFHEELREALKNKHDNIDTTNFAIHLAGFCPTENKFMHFVLSTTKHSLNEPKKVEDTIFVGGLVDKKEIAILRENGIGNQNSALSIGKAASILVKSIEDIYRTPNSSLAQPTQLLMLEERNATWIKGPFTETIVDLL